MTDQEIIMHQARKIAELESQRDFYKKESNKYADWWLASTSEVTELKLKLEGGASNGSK